MGAVSRTDNLHFENCDRKLTGGRAPCSCRRRRESIKNETDVQRAAKVAQRALRARIEPPRMVD